MTKKKNDGKKMARVKCDECEGKGYVMRRIESYNVTIVAKDAEAPSWVDRCSSGSGYCFLTGQYDYSVRPKHIGKVLAYFKKHKIKVLVTENTEWRWLVMVSYDLKFGKYEVSLTPIDFVSVEYPYCTGSLQEVVCKQVVIGGDGVS